MLKGSIDSFAFCHCHKVYNALGAGTSKLNSLTQRRLEKNRKRK